MAEQGSSPGRPDPEALASSQHAALPSQQLWETAQVTACLGSPANPMSLSPGTGLTCHSRQRKESLVDDPSEKRPLIDATCFGIHLMISLPTAKGPTVPGPPYTQKQVLVHLNEVLRMPVFKTAENTPGQPVQRPGCVAGGDIKSYCHVMCKMEKRQVDRSEPHPVRHLSAAHLPTKGQIPALPRFRALFLFFAQNTSW